MRADRLLSILMLLQARGRMTAAVLARELEVSERTIYRDVDALSAAGVPIYAERGPGGGCALLESYRTTLTGLTPDESRALLLLQIPEPLTGLGIGDELRAALRKVFAAIASGGPSTPRPRVYLDWAGWEVRGRQAPSHLPALHAALAANRRVRITYTIPVGYPMEREVDPYGLVAKAGLWHLVFSADGKISTLPVSELLDALPLDVPFDLAPAFDLEIWWKEHCAEVEGTLSSFQCRVLARPELAPALISRFGETVRQQLSRPPRPDGRFELDLAFENIFVARSRLLAYGAAVEVLSPLSLRLTLSDFASQIAGLYHS